MSISKFERARLKRRGRRIWRIVHRHRRARLLKIRIRRNIANDILMESVYAVFAAAWGKPRFNLTVSKRDHKDISTDTMLSRSRWDSATGKPVVDKIHRPFASRQITSYVQHENETFVWNFKIVNRKLIINAGIFSPEVVFPGTSWRFVLRAPLNKLPRLRVVALNSAKKMVSKPVYDVLHS